MWCYSRRATTCTHSCVNNTNIDDAIRPSQIYSSTKSWCCFKTWGDTPLSMGADWLHGESCRHKYLTLITGDVLEGTYIILDHAFKKGHNLSAIFIVANSQSRIFLTVLKRNGSASMYDNTADYFHTRQIEHENSGLTSKPTANGVCVWTIEIARANMMWTNIDPATAP